MNNFLNNKSVQKGQALVELAIFGTILLFCLTMLVNFGLQANYQQETGMKAFRQAMQQSYNKDEDTNPALKKGPSSGAEITLIEDKHGISTQDAYGINERYQSGATGRVTWNNNIMDEYTDKNNNPRPNYLPKVSYEVNGEKLEFTTANFETYPCPPKGTITIRVADNKDKYNINGTPGSDGIYWKDVKVDCDTQTKVFIDESSEGKPLTGYAMIDGEKEPISNVYIGPDGVHGGRQKLVVNVSGTIYTDPDTGEKYGGKVDTFYVIDYQKGQIDNTIDRYQDCNGDLNCLKNKQQGLLPNYVKKISKTGDLDKTESTTDITTASSGTLNEDITRTIRINQINPITGNNIEVPVNDKDKDITFKRGISWSVPK